MWIISKIAGLAIVVCLGFLTFLPTAVWAHVLETDGSIGAVLHVDPDDNPVVGQPATFFFDFKDTANKLDLSACSCTFAIREQGKQIFSQPFSQTGLTASAADQPLTYTFSQPDVYQVEVSGSPQTVGAFQSFKLQYDIRVSGSSSTGSNSLAGFGRIFLWGSGGLLIIVLAALTWKLSKRPQE